MQDLPIPDIQPLNHALEADIQLVLDRKTKPVGALGAIEDLARRVAMIQQTTAPVADGCQLLLFAADHGITASGVSAYPPEVTRQMVLNFLAGGAAANVFSSQNDVEMRVVDAGVAGEPIEHPALCSRRVGTGTRNFQIEAAMSSEEMQRAMMSGIALGEEMPYRFAAFGEMGIGNTSSAAMLAHKLHGYPLQTLVGRGAGLDDEGLQRKLEILQQASARTASTLTPLRCLQEYGGFEIVMMAGAMIGAASNGRCLLIDGFIATSALLVANALCPGIQAYALFTHNSAESGHRVMLDGLGEPALLDLNLRLGEGTGALLAWPLVRCAVHMLTDMASFESSGVSDKS